MGAGSVNGLPLPPYEDTTVMRSAALGAANIVHDMAVWLTGLAGDDGARSEMREKVQRTLEVSGMEAAEAAAFARDMFGHLYQARLSIDDAKGRLRCFADAVDALEEKVREQRYARQRSANSLEVN